MKLHEHFLSTDLEQASKEYSCAKDCLMLINTYLEQGDIEKAKQRTIDMLHSMHELSKLEDRKLSFERNKHLFNGMPTVTHIELTRMMKHE